MAKRLVAVTRSWPVTQGLPLALHELAEGTVSTDPLVATHCSNPKYWHKKVEWGPRHKPGPDQLKSSQVTFNYIALLTIQLVKATAQYQNRNIFELKAFHY